MKQLLELGLPILNGHISIPPYATQIRIDVGLSVNAPQSATWLEREKNLFVLGFEPIQSNIDFIHAGNAPWPRNLNPALIGNRMAIVRAALSSTNEPSTKNFYVTKPDPGCSSFLEPKSIEVDRIEVVHVFKLDTILNFFPYQRIPYIEHLKIDAQGSDFDVLKGAKENLSKILFITLEIDTENYVGGLQTENEVSNFLSTYGFRKVDDSIVSRMIRRFKRQKFELETDDPTYINVSLYSKLGNPRIWIYQRG
jgi:FkbM family methyltransferase